MTTAEARFEELAEAKHPVFEDHIRQSFGDEIARVSKPPLMERYRYFAWMIDNDRKHGVKNTREPRGVTESSHYGRLWLYW